MQKAQGYSNTRTYDLVLTAILIALVFVATVFLNIKLPITANGGLIHLGTAMLFLASILFGPKKGAIAGAVGSARRQPTLGQVDPVLGSDRYQFVVEVVMGIVQGTTAATGTVAQPGVATRLFGQHVREVFGAHRRQFVHPQLFSAEHVPRHLTTDLAFCHAIDRCRIAMIEAH